jgi:hypothetical protein
MHNHEYITFWLMVRQPSVSVGTFLFGEDAIQLAARVHQQGAGRGYLGRCSLVHDLPESCPNLLEKSTQFLLTIIDAANYGAPRIGQFLTMLLHICLSAVGQMKDASPLALLNAHKPLILKQLERRVDRSRAWLPDTATALTHALHQVIPVRRLFHQQQQQGGTHVSTPNPRSIAATTTMMASRLKLRPFFKVTSMPSPAFKASSPTMTPAMLTTKFFSSALSTPFPAHTPPTRPASPKR